MAEIPKLGMEFTTLSPSHDVFGLKEKGTQKISVFSDQTNGFNHKNENSDSFILDMENFSSSAIDKDITHNSRFTLQRSLSRKGSHRERGSEKKTNSIAAVTANEKDTGAAIVGAACTPESTMAVVAVGTTDHLPSNSSNHNNPQAHHHQITITAGNISTNTTESKCMTRRSSFRRSSPTWTIDPRKILFFFATLSSMGTILLIYFTLSMSKLDGVNDDALDWPQ